MKPFKLALVALTDLRNLGLAGLYIGSDKASAEYDGTVWRIEKKGLWIS